ncbi:MAG: hypothetical protein CMP23_14245 [Rickettsiales bacterium]|nr:hypothetical protein [Rickettsiales bacterium]|tara:strand:+ start:4086 stop:6812 length:2727 start_codon:yes stop_codon:yes gene_type:complete
MSARATISRLPSLALALLLMLLLAPAAQATEQTGKIRGTITDEDGSVLEGARVRVTSESLQGLRSAESDKSGLYWLPGLPPGQYQLNVEYEGFQGYTLNNIRVLIGATLDIDVTLRTASVEESVTVVDDRPLIDTSTSTTGSVITREYLEALPTSRSYQSAVKFAPGVTGGSNPNAQGGSSRENKWLLDGANTTDPVTGTFSFNFNLDAIEEVEVITGNFRAENGGSLGAIINVRTKSGSNKLEGGVKGFYSNGNWSPKRDATFVPDGRQIEGSEFDRDSESFDLNAFVGGPILRDKLWFFNSVRYIRNTSTALGARSPRVFDGFNIFSKLTANPAQGHHLIFSVMTGPARISNRRQSFSVDPEAQAHQYQNSLVASGEWQWFINNNLSAKFHYSHLQTDIDVTPQPCTWRDDDRFKTCLPGQEEGYIDFVTPGRIGVGGARSTGNSHYFSLNDRWRDSLRATLTAYVPRALGVHEIKGGVEVSFVRSTNTFGYTGNLYYVDRLEEADDPTSTVNYYWRETQGQLHQTNRGTTVFAYLQDSWEPTPGLTIDFGLKYDHAVMRNDEGEKIVNFDAVSPVAGVAWDPTGQGQAKIYAGGGVVIDESRLAISSFIDKNGLGRKLYLGPYFDGRDSNNSYDQWSYDRGQSNYESLPDLTVPRIYTVAAGFDMQLGGRTSVGVIGTAKFFRNLWEDDEVNYIWNGEGTNSVGVINGQQDYFFRLRTPDAARRNWLGITFKIERQMFKNLLLDINYTMSMTRGLTSTQITAAMDNPTQTPHEYGWLYSDRPHVLKASAAYKLPFGLTLGGTLNVTSGSRFDRKYYADKGSGYQNYVAERGTFDSVNPWWALNLKLRYNLRLPRGKLFFSAELNNVTNNRQATGINTGALNAGGEYFASGRQSPMTLELGGGYEW